MEQLVTLAEFKEDIDKKSQKVHKILVKFEGVRHRYKSGKIFQ